MNLVNNNLQLGGIVYCLNLKTVLPTIKNLFYIHNS